MQDIENLSIQNVPNVSNREKGRFLLKEAQANIDQRKEAGESQLVPSANLIKKYIIESESNHLSENSRILNRESEHKNATILLQKMESQTSTMVNYMDERFKKLENLLIEPTMIYKAQLEVLEEAINQNLKLEERDREMSKISSEMEKRTYEILNNSMEPVKESIRLMSNRMDSLEKEQKDLKKIMDFLKSRFSTQRRPPSRTRDETPAPRVRKRAMTLTKIPERKSVCSMSDRKEIEILSSDSEYGAFSTLYKSKDNGLESTASSALNIYD